eukprot:4259658-Alexandrium_andersonii.AAC.1
MPNMHASRKAGSNLNSLKSMCCVGCAEKGSVARSLRPRRRRGQRAEACCATAWAFAVGRP